MTHGTDRKVRLFDSSHIYNALPIALTRNNLWPREKIEDIFILDIRCVPIKGDQAPFYAAVFRALKKMGYDWSYFNSVFYDIISYIQEYYQLKWSPIVENDDGMVASEILEEIVSLLERLKLEQLDPLDEEAIRRAINRMPPNEALLAYLSVYGDLPQKYPLRLSDYKKL